jgi:hypothetical protein
MLQPVYTMNGFNWLDKRGTEGVGFVRTLRTLLTNSLPKLLPELGALNRARFEDLYSKHPVVDGRFGILVRLTKTLLTISTRRHPLSGLPDDDEAHRLAERSRHFWDGNRTR